MVRVNALVTGSIAVLLSNRGSLSTMTVLDISFGGFSISQGEKGLLLYGWVKGK